jgi:hypothetical protein
MKFGMNDTFIIGGHSNFLFPVIDNNMEVGEFVTREIRGILNFSITIALKNIQL